MYKLPNIQDMFELLSQNWTVPDTFSVIHLASAFNYFWIKSALNYSPSTLEKVYLGPRAQVLG